MKGICVVLLLASTAIAMAQKPHAKHIPTAAAQATPPPADHSQVPQPPAKPGATPAEPVEVTIPQTAQTEVDMAWKDLEIAQLKLQMKIQQILSSDPTMSYNLATKKFYKPKAKPAEPVKAPEPEKK